MRRLQPVQRLARLMRDRRRHLIQGQHVLERLGVGGVVGLRRGHGDVRHHAGALPVRPGDRVDGTRERYADVHRGADRETPGRVGAAAGRLADHCGPAQGLQRVGEVLAAGERVVAGQHVDRPVGVAGARHVGQRPELPGLAGVGVEDVVEVRGPLVEQVAAPQHHALGRAAAVVPQVDDERVGPGDQFHGRGDGRPRVGRDGHPAHVQVADVAVKPLDVADAEVVQAPPLPHGQSPGLVVLGLLGFGMPLAPGTGTAAEHHAQVPVVGDLLQVAGEQLGEGDLVQVVVLAGLQPRLDHGGGPLGLVGEHVVGPQQLQRLGHDLAPGQLLGGQRPVVGHADPRRAGLGEGELEQPGRGQPQRKLPPDRVDPRLVGVLPRGQRLLRRPVRGRDEHPHHQLSPFDGRVVAVLQQHGPLHRADAEPLLHLVVDNSFDHGLLGLIHDASARWIPVYR